MPQNRPQLTKAQKAENYNKSFEADRLRVYREKLKNEALRKSFSNPALHSQPINTKDYFRKREKYLKQREKVWL